jgi:1,3-propanediol dehydrogenase/alcohol dehydrogenase
MPAGREPTLVVYQFRLPEVTHFGWGAVEGVGQEAARLGRRALLVTGRAAMKQTGTADRVVALLAAAGVSVRPYDGIESDPRAATIDRAAKAARAEGCDLVVGLGGGSPMDAARAIAAMAVLEGSITDYLDGKAIDRPGLPLINIATTAGTASEITSVAVVLHERKQLKMGLKSPFWFARVAITDPELTLTMPPALTAATGLDALTHAIESYVSTQATPPSEGLALRAIELVGLHLRAAFADGSNRPAREGMALASMTAGMAFANSGLGLVHGLVHPIGARFGVPHGMACGRLLPLVMRYNQPAAEEKMAQVGRALTRRPEAAAGDAADAVESLLRDLGVPAGIGDVGVPADQIPSLARDGLLAGAVRTNPRPVTEQEALALLEEARER